jgi:hypothetical protein
MEFLIIEYPLIKDSEVYYFKDGIEITDRAEIDRMKNFFVKLSQQEDSLAIIVEKKTEEINYTCYTSIPPIEERRNPIIQRIEYFIKAREQGSEEYVHVLDKVAGRSYTLLYNNGFLVTDKVNVRFEEKGKLVERYKEGRFQVSIYTANLDGNGNPLTFQEYIYLIKRDIPDQIEVLGKPSKRPVKEVEYNRPHPKYDGLILKRVGDVVCLSNGLVKHFQIGTPSFAFFKLHRNELYVQFSNLDTHIGTIQYKINLTRYARRSLVDGANFPCLIYFKLTDVLDNGEEYEVSKEPVLIDGNHWYLVSW